MKRGTLERIRNKIKKIKAVQDEREKQVSILNKSGTGNTLRPGSKSDSRQQLFKKQTSKIPKGGKSKNLIKNNNKTGQNLPTSSNDQNSKGEIERRFTLKTQCHLDIIEPKEKGNIQNDLLQKFTTKLVNNYDRRLSSQRNDDDTCSFQRYAAIII